MLELIIEHPMFCILSAVGMLIFFLVLFKIGNWLEKVDWSGQSKSKESSKKETTIKEVKEKVASSDTSKIVGDIKEKSSDDKESKSNAESSKNGPLNNYLYDRYVETPCREDHFPYSSKANDAFLTDGEIDAIQKRKIKIRVKENEEKSNNAVYKKLQEASVKEEKDREKILAEFNQLPRSMKLMIIQNILNTIE